MVGLIAFGRPDSFVIGPKVYGSKFKSTYRTFGTVTTPATKAMSMGLPADAQAVMVFASSSGQFYHDVTTRVRLSGLGHLDNFIVTRNFRPSTGTLQKPRHRLTQTATNPTTGPLALMRRYLHNISFLGILLFSIFVEII